MTTTTKTPDLFVFHALQDGLTLPTTANVIDPARPSTSRLATNHVTRRGETYTVDLAELILATQDRDGYSPFEHGIVDDRDLQLRTWKKHFLASGPSDTDPELMQEVEAIRQAQEDKDNQATIIQLSRGGNLQKVIAELARADRGLKPLEEDEASA